MLLCIVAPVSFCYHPFHYLIFLPSCDALLSFLPSFLHFYLSFSHPVILSFLSIILSFSEIVRVALLLTGCIQGIRNTVQDYLNSFATYNWIWKDDKESSYGAFVKTIPSLDDFDRKLRSFGDVEAKIGLINDQQNIGALSLRTVSIKAQLRSECHRWSVKFSDNLHGQSKNRLEQLTEYIRVTTGKVVREVSDLDSLRFIMRLLVDVRERESSMEMEISPIMDMYRMLESYLPAGFMDKVRAALMKYI
jgi:dynein heavy chain, axonemal